LEMIAEEIRQDLESILYRFHIRMI
jgi:hypothetical protein